MIVVSDTSPVSNLWMIGQLDLLNQLFGEIIIPEGVVRELLRLTDYGLPIGHIFEYPWIIQMAPSNPADVDKLRIHLDIGESEAIALAQELGADHLLIDERAGWRYAQSQGLNPVGILGVLLLAKEKNLIDSVRPHLDSLEMVAGFWIAPNLREKVLAIANESDGKH
jgi:uncharacterized protein